MRVAEAAAAAAVVAVRSCCCLGHNFDTAADAAAWEDWSVESVADVWRDLAASPAFAFLCALTHSPAGRLRSLWKSPRYSLDCHCVRQH